jgi:hypothetical protein
MHSPGSPSRPQFLTTCDSVLVYVIVSKLQVKLIESKCKDIYGRTNKESKENQMLRLLLLLLF